MCSAHIVTVNVEYQIRPGYFQDTAIDKRPVDGPVEVTSLGVCGDQQLSRAHGGLDKAVYAYAAEDAEWWASELGRDIPPGMFGENLRRLDWMSPVHSSASGGRSVTRGSRCGCPERP